VEFHAGSLGHLVSVAAGVALDVKLRAERNRIVVVAGDGELNEGSMWEAFLVAAARRLDNLIIVIDRNRLQANAATEDLIPLEPLAPKLQSFGLAVERVNGHDFPALAEAFSRLPLDPGRPTAIIANTVRGKGIPSIEDRVDQWFCNLSPEQEEELLQELGGGSDA
jgi:transketolase